MKIVPKSFLIGNFVATFFVVIFGVVVVVVVVSEAILADFLVDGVIELDVIFTGVEVVVLDLNKKPSDPFNNKTVAIIKNKYR